MPYYKTIAQKETSDKIMNEKTNNQSQKIEVKNIK